jgi:hypothetical protein
MNVVDAGKQNVTMYYLVSARSRGKSSLGAPEGRLGRDYSIRGNDPLWNPPHGYLR